MSGVGNGKADVDGANHSTTRESTDRHKRPAFTSMKSKDDTCTQTRVRHPTDRGQCPAAAPLSPSLFAEGAHLLECGSETRSRAYSATVRPAGRMNLYKRMDGSTWTKESNSSEKEKGAKTCAGSNGCVANESPTKTAAKRDSWLQRGWRSAQVHSPTPTKQITSTIGAISSPEQEPVAELVRKPVATSSGGISGFLDRLRPRSNSDASTGCVVPQQILISRRKKNAAADGTGSNKGSQSDQSDETAVQCSPALQPRHVAVNDNGEVLEVDAWLDDDNFDRRFSPASRKRSNSEATNFLILRKTSRPNRSEVLGSLDRQEDAYKQLLTKFTCYDLMPTQGAVVVIDSQLPTRQVLNSLSENGVRAAVLWDSRQASPIRLVTVTDLLLIMVAYFSQTALKTPTIPDQLYPTGFTDQLSKSGPSSQGHSDLADILRQPILSNLIKAGRVKASKMNRRSVLTTVAGEDTLQLAALTLRSNRLHRVAVTDADSGNPLYLLSSKKLFHFLYNHMTNLPVPSAVYKSLDELRLGTWIDTSAIISVTLETTLMEATDRFLESGVSSLAVVDTCKDQGEATPNGHCSPMEIDPNCTCKPNRLTDSLTKVDLMHFITVSGWSDLQGKTVADVLKVRHNNMEKLVSCHRKMPLNMAIDQMIQSHAHRIYIVDSSGALEGILSVGDLLSFLLD